MQYKSYQDLANVIRTNLYKVPDDVLCVVGIPRSGMIAALIIAETLNLPCIDIYQYINQEKLTFYTGQRNKLMNLSNRKAVLIVDDTVNKGGTINGVKEKIKASDKSKMKTYYACAFAEGEHAKEFVDFYFCDNSVEGGDKFLYEWNIFHHYLEHMQKIMFDLDGVFCLDPPDDHNIEEYEAYIKDAKPMGIYPKMSLGAICTYRLEKYREITQNWLDKVGIKTKNLIMYPADNREERSKIPPYVYKAHMYKSLNQFELFVESSPFEAVNIAKLSGKPVLCFQNGILYK